MNPLLSPTGVALIDHCQSVKWREDEMRFNGAGSQHFQLYRGL